MANITTTVPKTTQTISTTTTQTEYVFDKSQSDITFTNTGGKRITVLVKSNDTYTVELLPGQTKSINNQRIFSFKATSDGNSTLNVICSPWEYEPDQEPIERDTVRAQLDNMKTQVSALTSGIAVLDNVDVLLSRLEGETVNYVKSYGQSVEAFDTAVGWTNETSASATITDDTVNYKSGGHALKFSVTTAGGLAQGSKTINLTMGALAPRFTFWVYAETALVTSEITVRFSSVANFSTYFSQVASASMAMSELKQGWNLIVFSPDKWTNTGGESWSNTMVRMRVKIQAQATSLTAITLDSMFCGYMTEPKIIFTFDDASAGVYTNAYPILKGRGMKATTYAIGDQVGDSARMTLEQLKELYSNGWDVGNHGYSHLNYTGMSVVDIQADLQSNIDYLQANGFGRSALHLGIPNGVYTPEVLQAMLNVGMVTTRNSGAGTRYPEQLNLLEIPITLNVVNTTAVSVVTEAINNAVTNGKTCVLMFHEISDVEGGMYEYTKANFQLIIDYIYDNLWEDTVISMTNFYKNLNR